MAKTCCAAAGLPVAKITPVALVMAVMLALGSPAEAASIGHSRMVSASGQPLRIDVPIRDLSAAEQQSLQVSVAPPAAWQQAGLTPPVELASVQVSVEQGFSADSRIIQLRSSQAFNGAVADLLLHINTAAGSQQHQVSLLANTARSAPAVGGQGGAGGSQPSGVALGAPAAQGGIAVRRGDTLFALAQANAVEGVTVYQMMVALLRANPQAFIEGNLNLVKAGATLAIPDAAALRAVSDREARRIFQQHVQAYAAYRQGLAGQSGDTVKGGSTQSGSVSTGGSAHDTPLSAEASGDQVVLSSGTATDAAADQRDATQRNIEESETRVSQLERNVHSLNQALQMQGEAAKDAVLDGAAAVSQTLSDAASSVGIAEDSASAKESADSRQTDAQSAGAADSNSSGADSNSTSATTSGAADASQTGTESAQSGAESSSGSSTGSSGSMAGNSASSAGSSGATVGNSSEESAQAGSEQAGSTQAGAAKAALGQAGGATAATEGAGQQTASGSEESNTSTSSKAEQSVSWLQQNLLGVITAILALVVLIIAWVLRRASASRGAEGQGVVTEAMVQERLEKIDLDLANPPDDRRPPHSA